MNYFVPAWHKQENDWAYSQPSIEFDDAVSHLRILQDNNYPVGVILTDYQPQLTTKLNHLAFFPNKIWSVFDYLQGIDTLNSQVIDIRDLNWPKGAYFDYTNFRTLVLDGDQLYAVVCYDTQGKILWIDYHAGKYAGSRMLMDSRGFISRQSLNQTDTYFDQQGNWRFKHDRQTDQVTVNPRIVKVDQEKYSHLSTLLEEIVVKQFLPRLKSSDDLIVTADDESTVDLAQTFNQQNPIYSVSRWHPFEQKIGAVSNHPLITDTTKTANRIKQLATSPKRLDVLPLFQSQFKLGHSQRVSEQRIAVFAEYMSESDLTHILDGLYPRLIKEPDENALYLFTYSGEKSGMVNQVFNQFRKKHNGDFILSLNEIDPGENKLDAEEIPPLLKVKQERFTANAQVLKALDKIRLIIMWGQSDEFMSMAAVSVGIPVLQNFENEEVEDHHNGLICHNWDELIDGVAYYLDTIKNWNQSLVYNVQMLNKYSEENLLNHWQKIIKRDES